MKRIFLLFLGFVAIGDTAPTAAKPAADARTEAWDKPIAAIRNVGREGKGNPEAAAAWATLTAMGSEMILPVLGAMEESNPMARNWLRSAVETVFEAEETAGASLPAADFATFVREEENGTLARELAFEFFEKTAPDDAAAMIPDFRDDPSTTLRRAAVAQLIDEGDALLADDEKESAAATFRTALDAARDIDQIETIAKTLEEKLDAPVDLPKHFGFLMRWHMIAPFDNTDRDGFDAVYPPETSLDLEAEYEGKDGRTVSWEPYETANDYGMVDFNGPFSPLKQVVGYATTEFEAAETREAELRLGCKNAWKIWLNGELLFGRDEYHRGIRIDQYVLPVTLQKGTNTILVKACQNEQEQNWTVQWEFQLRVCDSTGTAILATNRLPTPEPKAKPGRRPE